MGCSSFIVRNILFLFNFIFVVAGLALLVLGVLIKLDLDTVVPDRYQESIRAAPILSIIIGSIIFVIAFLGCCGAIRKSKCMLIMYAVIILCILVIQIAAGVIAFMNVRDNGGEFKKEIGNILRMTIDEYESNKAAKEYMDLIQQKFKCCGAVNHNDYPPTVGIPGSCCEDNKSPCKNYFKDGCTTFVNNEMKTLSERIGMVALGLCCTELLTIIFSLCLVSSISNEKRRGRV